LWPVTVAHRIDKTSPFYSMGPREILTSKFELVVTCEGINETNGNSVQVKIIKDFTLALITMLIRNNFWVKISWRA
jgi:hypothetical protein